MASAHGKSAPQTFAQVRKSADEAFGDARFAKAAALYERALALLPANDILSDAELALRERLVLSHYDAGDKPAALAAYKALIERFPRFEFDLRSVTPETKEYFTKAAPSPVARPSPPAERVASPAGQPASQPSSQPTSQPISQPGSIIAAPAASPRAVVTSPSLAHPPWHWYYLAPLGIGQFLAKSPVRGTLFLTLELGAVAANVACAVLFANNQLPNGRFVNVGQSRGLQAGMDVAFFTLLTTVVVAIIDGAAFEP